MKIEPSKLIPNPHLQPAKEPKEAEPEAHVVASLVPQDRVDVSSLAEETERIQAEVSARPDVRLDRIHELRERIARGEYVVDSKAIAERLLEQAVGIARRSGRTEGRKSS